MQDRVLVQVNHNNSNSKEGSLFSKLMIQNWLKSPMKETDWLKKMRDSKVKMNSSKETIIIAAKSSKERMNSWICRQMHKTKEWM